MCWRCRSVLLDLASHHVDLVHFFFAVERYLSLAMVNEDFAR